MVLGGMDLMKKYCESRIASLCSPRELRPARTVSTEAPRGQNMGWLRHTYTEHAFDVTYAFRSKNASKYMCHTWHLGWAR
jgi:hypothetical protein